MKSRPGIFIGLMALFVTLTLTLGVFVVQHSRQKESQVALQNSQYEQRKMQRQNQSIENSDTHPEQKPQELTPDPTPPSSNGTPANSDPAPASVTVYLSKHPDSDNDPSAVFPLSRTIGDNVTQADALIQLFAGPTDEEKQQDYYGGLQLRGASNCGGKDFTLSIANSLATVQLCRYHVSGGSAQDKREEAQIAATLKQFGGISGVVVLDALGHCIFAQGTNACPNNSSR